jgi:hypothetical protein
MHFFQVACLLLIPPDPFLRAVQYNNRLIARSVIIFLTWRRERKEGVAYLSCEQQAKHELLDRGGSK